MGELALMGTGVPGLTREDMWPTGDMPGELRSAMAAEAAAMGAASTHEVVPSNIAAAPRDFDPASLEAERPPMVEGDALIDNLRSALGNGRNGGTRPAPMQRPAIPASFYPISASADMHYAFPLSANVRAEVNLYGAPTADDLDLLVDYLKLTARKMKHGEATNASLPEHDSSGSDEKLPAKRSRVRSGTGR